MTQIDISILNKLNKFKTFQPNLTNIPNTFHTPLSLYIPQFNTIGYFPQYKAQKEPVIEITEKQKFNTKKRGRKIKDSDKNLSDNVHDKFSNDNVKRRVKARYHNYIIYLLNFLMKKNFKGCKRRFLKINSDKTKDIGIEFNRNLMSKEIKEIILDVSKKYSDKLNNKECIKYIMEQNNNEEILKILEMPYKDLYTDYYLKSKKADFDNDPKNESFEEHKEKLKEIYGETYLEKFLENTKNFIDFFMNGKNRKIRNKKKDADIISHHSEKSDNEQIDTTTNTNETTNGENSENVLNKKIMVSIGTQTEIENIYTKIITFS